MLSPRVEANYEMEGGTLIDTITKSWNEVLLSRLFLPFEVEKILSISLSHRLPEDSLCWDLEKYAIYSVKSAYHAIVDDAWHLRKESTFFS